MENILELISFLNTKINNFVWGPYMIALMIGTGLFLTLNTKFLQFRKFGYAIKNTIGGMFSGKHRSGDESGVSSFQAVATAMAGTIGTGSIAGIATAIVSGGPGAIFWMWVSALLGMVTKYSEIVLSIAYREKDKKGQWIGGPMYYIRNGLGLKWLAGIFAVFAIFACMGTGNATQSNSISVALKSTVNISPEITGIVLTIIVSAVILGGMRRISSVNEKLVPAMAFFYVACSLIAIIINIQKVPAAFALIFKEAFNFKSAVGGVAGYGVMTAMHYGFSRGIFSNEAGLGSAPIAHSASSAKNPVDQGLWGMFEVFFTTIIICTMSALVILTTGLWQDGEFLGAALSIASFNKILPGVGSVVVTLSTIFFALSTILGWAYYGEVSIKYLTKNNHMAVRIYRIAYVVVVFVGAVGNLEVIWSISETMNGLMMVPNLIGLLGLYKVVKKHTKEYFDNKKQVEQ